MKTTTESIEHVDSKKLGAWILMKLASYAELLKRLNDKTNAQEKRLAELVAFITKEGM